jgi:antitoxin HicB
MPDIQTFGYTHDEALAMAKEALDGCLEVSIEHGYPVPPPSFTGGYPITVTNHIAVSLRLRELRGEQSPSAVALRLGLSYRAYQRLENPSKSNPTIKTLDRIARIYGQELKLQIG